MYISGVCTKKLHKMKFKKIYNFLFLKLNRNFKQELSLSKPLLCSTQSLILGRKGLRFSIILAIEWLDGEIVDTTKKNLNCTGN